MYPVGMSRLSLLLMLSDAHEDVADAVRHLEGEWGDPAPVEKVAELVGKETTQVRAWLADLDDAGVVEYDRANGFACWLPGIVVAGSVG